MAVGGGKRHTPVTAGLLAWYRFALGITKVPGCTVWADATGNNRSLLQTGPYYRRPEVLENGELLFDGVNMYMQASFTLPQPCTVYVLFRQVTWSSGAVVMDGVSAQATLTQSGSTPQLVFNAGSALSAGSAITANAYGVACMVMNGASSVYQNVGQGFPVTVTGNAGSNTPGGLTIGCDRNIANFAKIGVREIIVYSGAHDTVTSSQVVKYLSQNASSLGQRAATPADRVSPYTTAPQYVGQVATACRPCCFFANATNELMTRSRHLVRSPISYLQIAYPNFMIDAPGGTYEEEGSGGTMMVAAGLETRTGGNLGSFTWSGDATPTVADGAMQVLSDPLEVDIPSGSEIFIRTYAENDGPGIIVNGLTGNLRNNSDTANGEQFNYSTGAVNQTTGTGTITGGLSSAAYCYTPSLIVSDTIAPSAFLLGTSRTWGVSDPYVGASGDFGETGRAIGPSYAYTTYGVPGNAAVGLVASHTNQVAIGQYFTDIICELGTNDAKNFAQTTAQIIANLLLIAGYWPTKRFHQCTIVPRATSSNGFIDVAGQTRDSTYDVISALNQRIRAGTIGFNSTICDIASVLESSLNSGFWLPNSVANFYTPDGVHEKTAANLLIQSSGVVHL